MNEKKSDEEIRVTGPESVVLSPPALHRGPPAMVQVHVDEIWEEEVAVGGPLQWFIRAGTTMSREEGRGLQAFVVAPSKTIVCDTPENLRQTARMAAVWQGRAEGLVISLREAWKRGVGFDRLPAFDRTKPWAEQEEAFDGYFMPWKFDPAE